MQERCVRGHDTVHVSIDQHVVVESVDRVVQRGPVAPNLYARFTVERPIERQRVSNLRRERRFADSFFEAAPCDFTTVGVADDEANRLSSACAKKPVKAPRSLPRFLSTMSSNQPEEVALVIYLDPDSLALMPPADPAEWPSFVRLLHEIRDGAFELAAVLQRQS
jgi:hypothetical protein